VRSLLLLAAVVSCAGADVSSYAGQWSGQARLWLGPAKPETIHIRIDITSDGAVTGLIGGAKCRDGRLANRTWWQLRSFNRYDIRVDCVLSGAIAPGVVRERGTVALIPGGTGLRGWFFSEGHDGFPLFPPTQARAGDLVLRRR